MDSEGTHTAGRIDERAQKNPGSNHACGINQLILHMSSLCWLRPLSHCPVQIETAGHAETLSSQSHVQHFFLELVTDSNLWRLCDPLVFLVGVRFFMDVTGSNKTERRRLKEMKQGVEQSPMQRPA